MFLQPDSARSYDTCSDNEADDVSSIIADSQRSINSVETRKTNLEEDGFVKDAHLQEYVSHPGHPGERRAMIKIFCLPE